MNLDAQKSVTRLELEAAWLHLTRVALPALARERGWPVTADHCFQRILLDNACGGRWYNTIPQRPAYRHAPADVLERAVALAHAAVADGADLAKLNRASIGWRRRLRK